MSENNNKMTSIARRINFDFWLKQFANFLMIDVVLVVLIAVTFFSYGGRTLCQKESWWTTDTLRVMNFGRFNIS